jgi:hypothetical protein
MLSTPTRNEEDYSISVRRCSGALLLSAVASLLIACGGASSSSDGTTSTATLTWDAVADPNVVGYRVYYGTVSGTYDQTPGQGLNVGTVTTYTVTGLSSGKRYFFTATAFTSNTESTYSNEGHKDIL